MTLDELNSTLSAALASGKVGTPVSLRLHLQVTESRNDSVAHLALLMPLLQTTFGSPPSRLLARRNAVADQLTVLFNFAAGQSAMVTCGCGSARHTSLQLLLVGNRGVIRLEGGELFESADVPEKSDAQFWRTLIERSITAGEPVSMSAS